jgi:hypothetical protein
VSAVRAGPNISNSRDKSNPAVQSANGGLIDVLIEISQERAKILEAMKQARLDGDDAEVLDRARQLTGLPPQKSFPARLSQNSEQTP